MREGSREDDDEVIAVEAGVSVDGLKYIGVEDESNDEDPSEETVETLVNSVDSTLLLPGKGNMFLQSGNLGLL